MHRHARDVDASKAFLAWLYPRLVAEHAYLTDQRDPSGIGLAAVVHPWESGLDNSPVWDRDLSEMVDPGWGRRPHTSGTTSSTAIPRTGRRTRRTTRSCSWRPATGTPATTIASSRTRSRSSWPARCSTRSSCGRRMPSPRSHRSSAPIRCPTVRPPTRLQAAMLRELLGPAKPGGSAPSTRSGTSAQPKTRSCRSRRCSTRTSRRSSSRRSWPNCVRRTSIRTDRTASSSRATTCSARDSTSADYWRGPVWDQHELAAPGGPPPARLPLGGRRDHVEQPPARRSIRVPRVLRPVRRDGVRDRRVRPGAPR